MPVPAQSHEKLAGRWEQSDGGWFIKFEKGNLARSTWSGPWEGKLHHTKKERKGVYGLTMTSEHEGTLILYESNTKVCEATVHLGKGHLTYREAHYYRK